MDGFQNQGGGSSSQRTKPLIQRVPPVLLNMTLEFKKCFEPRLVSLGPLHHGDPKFQSAEVSKLQFAAFFALENRTTDDSLFGKIKAEIKDLRKCFKPDDIKDYDYEKLAWMLFIDENQIHYGVLQILIESANDPQKWKKSLKGFIAQNLVTNIPGEHKRSTVKVPDREDYAHLLEWLRAEHLVGDEVKRESSTIGNMLLYCADSQRHGKTFHSITELRESGIHVKPTQTINLKNIYFYCKFLGKLMMPHLLVDDSTVSKFLNLVALETCRDFRNEFEITTYLCFLDSLINTADDVKELSGTLMWITTYLCFLNSLIDTADDVKEQRVTVMLHNYLGSDEEVADLFNKMSRDLVPDQQWYSDVVKDIHKCCNNPWTAALAYAYYTHFSSSWSILAFLGAIIGLLFSATQAYSRCRRTDIKISELLETSPLKECAFSHLCLCFLPQ
ncbi:Tetratricopeptide repeat (TPR)-like superfamily protein [Hibiscus syriacus]|uniref:Tetratricopeptide repeat (TPR)-like superfamily protein n=1 Tax=Hibiscus syriacus TaxID=106335 RepID=A0A6A2XUX6_HIBSY|nr:Tetratricopeptide repeat (TPR)-like superfamily protein [Hibiscus syriacus]